MPAGVGKSNDLGDSITAGVGLALYGVTNFVRTRAHRSRIPWADPMMQPPDEGQAGMEPSSAGVAAHDGP